MAASDNLGPQFISHTDLHEMYSGDFDVKMPQARQELRDSYRNDQPEGVHPNDAIHGGPDKYIAHLKKDIAKNGMREPLEIRGGNVVKDGNHRALAAIDLKMNKIPVRHVR